MIPNLFNILKTLDELKSSISPEIYKEAKTLYKKLEDFSNYGSAPNLTFSAIIPENGNNYRPIFMINVDSLETRYVCTCHSLKEPRLCKHTLALIFAIEDYLKSFGDFNENYHIENNFEEYLGIIDYGESYYLIYPERSYTMIKIGYKKGNKILLRKDLDSYEKMYRFLKTKVPDDETPIKKLIIPIQTSRKPGYILALSNFADLKR
ncbi:hypothetical protein [Marinitoga lauensis]|uniref:hypothetical protein n=1 Tax=Marinitoga lauensis TaxID=2201189 RepID=UPI00101194AD|nr:hypothetical protein [Marinitoga lauensis]